jgi:hypothetical protein
MQFLSLKFDSKVNCPVLKSIIFSNSLVLDVLSPIEGTYRSDNLFDFPESYERLEEIVKTYSANKLDTLF